MIVCVSYVPLKFLFLIVGLEDAMDMFLQSVDLVILMFCIILRPV